MIKVAAIVLTKNEEARIEECLKHVRLYVDYLLVLDGCSTDKTVEIAKKYADQVLIKEPTETDSTQQERNYALHCVPKEFTWLLWVDADERFDSGFLRYMKGLVEKAELTRTICFRFPRCNLPGGKDYPDYQVRLFPNIEEIEFKGIEVTKFDEVPHFKPEGVPLDQLDGEDRNNSSLPLFAVVTLDKYPIIHLPRRKDVWRGWWQSES